jgi:translation elongation factor P/translation initiation factor 5A
MAALIDAINVKRKTLFELENTPFSCLEAEVNTPTARGGQTLVRLKMRNLLTNASLKRHSRPVTSSRSRIYSRYRLPICIPMEMVLIFSTRKATRLSP